MSGKTFGVVLLLLLACAASVGQTSYKGLTPGQSHARRR